MLQTIVLMSAFSGLLGDSLISDTLCMKSGMKRIHDENFIRYSDSINSFLQVGGELLKNCKDTTFAKVNNECSDARPRLTKKLASMKLVLDTLRLKTTICLDSYNRDTSGINIDHFSPIKLVFMAADRFKSGIYVLLDGDYVLKYKIRAPDDKKDTAVWRNGHRQIRLNDSLYRELVMLIYGSRVLKLPAFRSREDVMYWRGFSFLKVQQKANQRIIHTQGFFPVDMQSFENALEYFLGRLPHETVPKSDFDYSIRHELCYKIQGSCLQNDDDYYIHWIKKSRNNQKD